MFQVSFPLYTIMSIRSPLPWYMIITVLPSYPDNYLIVSPLDPLKSFEIPLHANKSLVVCHEIPLNPYKLPIKSPSNPLKIPWHPPSQGSDLAANQGERSPPVAGKFRHLGLQNGSCLDPLRPLVGCDELIHVLKKQGIQHEIGLQLWLTTENNMA